VCKPIVLELALDLVLEGLAAAMPLLEYKDEIEYENVIGGLC
jgi:hypothetical protein